jgi:hypothetical protein
MAKVKIQGNASGAGIFTITPPATATDRTVTLPDATGTLLMTDGSGASLTGISAGADTSLSNLSATGNDKICKVWVNFNGTGTVAINSSFNVSSITDNGTGDYTVNFSTSMANANYSANTTGLSTAVATTGAHHSVGDLATGSVRIFSLSWGGNMNDVSDNSLTIFGD